MIRAEQSGIPVGADAIIYILPILLRGTHLERTLHRVVSYTRFKLRAVQSSPIHCQYVPGVHQTFFCWEKVLSTGVKSAGMAVDAEAHLLLVQQQLEQTTLEAMMRMRTSPPHNDMAVISGDNERPPRKRDALTPLDRFSGILEDKFKLQPV